MCKVCIKHSIQIKNFNDPKKSFDQKHLLSRKVSISRQNKGQHFERIKNRAASIRGFLRNFHLNQKNYQTSQ